MTLDDVIVPWPLLWGWGTVVDLCEVHSSLKPVWWTSQSPSRTSHNDNPTVAVYLYSLIAYHRYRVHSERSPSCVCVCVSAQSDPHHHLHHHTMTDVCLCMICYMLCERVYVPSDSLWVCVCVVYVWQTLSIPNPAETRLSSWSMSSETDFKINYDFFNWSVIITIANNHLNIYRVYDRISSSS